MPAGSQQQQLLLHCCITRCCCCSAHLKPASARALASSTKHCRPISAPCTSTTGLPSAGPSTSNVRLLSQATFLRKHALQVRTANAHGVHEASPKKSSKQKAMHGQSRLCTEVAARSTVIHAVQVQSCCPQCQVQVQVQVLYAMLSSCLKLQSPCSAGPLKPLSKATYRLQQSRQNSCWHTAQSYLMAFVQVQSSELHFFAIL